MSDYNGKILGPGVKNIVDEVGLIPLTDETAYNRPDGSVISLTFCHEQTVREHPVEAVIIFESTPDKKAWRGRVFYQAEFFEGEF